MNATEVNDVLDKLAEKIGVAVVVMGVKVMRAKQPEGSRMSSVDYLTNHEVAGGITLVVGCVCAYVGTLVATSNIARALAPLPSILGL